MGVAIVAAAAVSAISFRITTVEPREFVGLCASRHAPWICAVRHAVLWLQYEHSFGLTSLLLGLFAFVFTYRPLGVVALAFGAIAIINYNATEVGGWRSLRVVGMARSQHNELIRNRIVQKNYASHRMMARFDPDVSTKSFPHLKLPRGARGHG